MLALGAVSDAALAAPMSLEQEAAVPVEGKPFKAKLISVDSHWHLTFETSIGERNVLPVADLCWWGAGRRRRRIHKCCWLTVRS